MSQAHNQNMENLRRIVELEAENKRLKEQRKSLATQVASLSEGLVMAELDAAPDWEIMYHELKTSLEAALLSEQSRVESMREALLKVNEIQKRMRPELDYETLLKMGLDLHYTIQDALSFSSKGILNNSEAELKETKKALMDMTCDYNDLRDYVREKEADSPSSSSKGYPIGSIHDRLEVEDQLRILQEVRDRAKADNEQGGMK